MESVGTNNTNDTNEHCVINLTRINSLHSKSADISYILCGPLLTIIIVFGVVTNCLNLLVFWRTLCKPRVYLYLIILTIWDILLLISAFLLYSLPAHFNGGFYVYGTLVSMYPIGYTVTHITHSGSIWTMVMFAIERYYALCRPLKYLMWHCNERPKLLLSLVAIFAIVYRIPKYFELILIPCLETSSGLWITIIYKSELRENFWYKTFYSVIGGTVFFSLGPLVMILALSVAVALSLKNKSILLKDNNSSSNHEDESLETLKEKDRRKFIDKHKRITLKKERKMNLMLVVLMIKYSLCHILPMVLNLCERFMTEKQFHIPLIETLVDISNNLVVLNSSCNFILYLICGYQFRATLKLIFTKGQTRGRHNFVNGALYLSSYALTTHTNEFRGSHVKVSKSSLF